LTAFTNAGLFEKRDSGKTRIYGVNINHVLFAEIQSALRNYAGINNKIIKRMLDRTGSLASVYGFGDVEREYM